MSDQHLGAVELDSPSPTDPEPEKTSAPGPDGDDRPLEMDSAA